MIDESDQGLSPYIVAGALLYVKTKKNGWMSLR